MQCRLIAGFMTAVVCFGASLPADAGAAAAGGGLVCDEPVVDFGVRNDTEVVRHTFTLENRGVKPVTIVRVRSSCGCTVAQATRATVAPGETTAIEATLKLSGRRGRQHHTITLDLNDPEQPRQVLAMTGSVVMELGLNPSYLNFGQVHVDAKTSLSAVLESLQPDVRIVSVAGGSERFAVTIDPDGRGVSVATVPPLESGLVHETFTFATDHPRKLFAVLRVMAVVVGDAVVVPREILLRADESGPVRRAVMLRPTGKRRLRVQAVDVPDPAMTVATNTHDNGAVTLTLDGLDPARHDGTVITMHTDSANMPVIAIPVRLAP